MSSSCVKMTSVIKGAVLAVALTMVQTVCAGDDIQVDVLLGSPVRVSATFEASESARTLYVVYGDEDHGAYNWPNHAELCSVPANSTSVSNVALPDAIGTRYSRFRLTFVPPTRSTDYLQTDLVAQWDAIDNAGRGTNDNSSATWKDLVGGRDFDASGLIFGGDAVACPKGVTVGADLSALNLVGRAKTVEIVCHADADFATSSKNGYAFNLCNDVRLSLRNDLSNIFIQPVYNRFSDSCSYWASTSASTYNTKAQTITRTSYSLYNSSDPSGSTLYVENDRQTWSGWYYNATVTQNQDLTIGSNNAKFYISSIRIYNRSLTAAERAANYAVDVTRYLTPCVTSDCQTVAVPFSVACHETDTGMTSDLVFMPTNILRRLYIAYGKDGGDTTNAWKNVRFVQEVGKGECCISGLAVPAAAVASSGFRFFLIDARPSTDYLQTDLVAQWDAIDNAGRGTNDSSSATWKDLVGGRDFNATGLIFGSDAVACPKGVTASADLSALNLAGRAKTVEIICHADADFATSSQNAYAFNLCNDVQLSLRTDLSNIFIQPVYNRFSDNCSYWASTSASAYNTKAQTITRTSYSLYNSSDPSGSTLYVENARQTWSAWYYSRTVTQNQDLKIGSNNAKFYISSIRVYNRSLTAAERAANYEVDRSRYLGAAVVSATEYVKIPRGMILSFR